MISASQVDASPAHGRGPSSGGLEECRFVMGVPTTRRAPGDRDGDLHRPAKSRRLRRLLGQDVLGQGRFPGSTRLPPGLGQSPGGKRKRSSPPAAAGNLKPTTHKRGDTLDQEAPPPAPVVPLPGTVTDTEGQGTAWRTVRLAEPSIRVRAPWIGAPSGTIVETCAHLTRPLRPTSEAPPPGSTLERGYEDGCWCTWPAWSCRHCTGSC